MRSHHGLRRTSIVAGIGVALLFGAQPAAAAPTDTVAVSITGAAPDTVMLSDTLATASLKSADTVCAGPASTSTF